MAPTTDLNDGNLNFCICRYIKLWQYQVPDETSMELSEQGELFKDILQRVILTAQLEDATPSEFKIICMWIDGLKDEVTWVMFNGCRESRLKLDCCPVYPGMRVGVCCTSVALLQPHFHLNQKTNNQEVNLSEQSVKEHNSPLLFTIDSHHQH